MPQAFLVRVGIDSTKNNDRDNGGWNAPVDSESGEYVYVPLLQWWPELRARPEFRRGYAEVLPALKRFGATRASSSNAVLPSRLATEEMHLDPDFEHLTYGDSSTPRGIQISKFSPGDWIVFIASFQPVDHNARLHYAAFGKFVVDAVVPAKDVESHRAHENAHTRPLLPQDGDVVIRARRGKSGRLRRCIRIGELRGDPHPKYRVIPSILDAWGGIKGGGYIQQGSPFELLSPERFFKWWNDQEVELVTSNWD